MVSRHERVIMLADCQSFYASVEKAAHPEYRNKPVVVAGDPEWRSGVVLAACPLAKAYGVIAAETLGEALRKCPELVVIRPRMQEYIDVSLQITRILESFTDLVEPYSIDEQFLDVTHSLHLFGSPEKMARAIQERIRNETGVFTRLGISYCKAVAKMACDNYAKKNPSGIFLLPADRLPSDLWPLPVEKMFMVGPRMARHLFGMGIRTIGDLARTPPEKLRRRWGINGEVLWRIANGLDDSPVDPDTHRLQKMIGHQMTLPRDYRAAWEIDVILLELSAEVCRRSRHKGYLGTVVSVVCSGADFSLPQGFYRQMKLEEPTNLTREVYEAARQLFHRHWAGYPVRRIGVALSQLVPDRTRQLSLFEDRERHLALERAVDRIQERYGKTAILRAASLTVAGQARERAAKIGGHYK